MKVDQYLMRGVKMAQVYSPEILTALGISGVVTTAVLTAKSTVKAVRKVDAQKDTMAADDYLTKKEVVQLVWPDYVAPVGVGIATVGAIFGSHKASARRTAAAVAAYSLSHDAFAEYKAKVLDTVGETKERDLREEVVRDKINENPPPPLEQIVVGRGDSLCCDLATMRYFRSNMEDLKRAQNEINRRLLSEEIMTVREFYNEIGVWGGTYVDRLGWKAPKLMELVFTPVLHEETNEPCLAFTFNYVEPV